MECSVCFEKFTSTVRKEVECSSCKNHICKKCIISWLHERTNITCPMCNHIWTWKFAFDNIDKSFFNKYKEIQKEVLFKIEENFFADTQEFIILVKDKINVLRDESKKISELIIKYSNMDISKIKNDKYIKELGFVEDHTKREIINYFKEYHFELVVKTNEYHDALETGILNESEIKIIKNITPVCPCPAEQCRGYIRKINHKCGICDLQICKSCYMEQDKEHVCKKENIDSVKIIRKESKPCPTCGTRISKSEGCDQMYCIQCKTAFSWKTGEIEKGRIHNPHYYDDLRKKYGENIPREPDINPPGQLEIPDIYDVYGIIGNISDISLSVEFKNYYLFYIEKQQRYFHNIDHIREYRNIEDNTLFTTNFKDRVDYMNGISTRDIFMRKIYKNFKDNKYKREIFEIINNFNTIMKNILLQFYDTINNIRYSKDTKNIMGSYIKFRNLMSNYYKLSKETDIKLDEINEVYNYNKRSIDFYIN